MKVKASQITSDGLFLAENSNPRALELETESVKFTGPLHVEAGFTRITNAVTVEVSLSAKVSYNCSRCLKEFEAPFDKEFTLDYAVDRPDIEIDLDPEIREEIMLDYPVKILCQPGCKGICPGCGVNLNEYNCKCQK